MADCLTEDNYPPLKSEPPGNCGSRSGFYLAIGAHSIWGVVPLYFHALADVAPWIVLCHRVIWSVAFVTLLIFARREWAAIGEAFGSLRNVALLSASAVLIAINWLLFIYAISSGQALQASLGYFINPLLTVALGSIFFAERLRPWQWGAVLIALIAVLNLTLRGGGFPWLAMSLAASFACYGVVRKKANINSLHGLVIESIILLPLALGALLSLSSPREWSPRVGLLSWSGVITAAPLLMFGAAVRRLNLATMGFIQYVGPTMQFLVAVLVFHEPLNPAKVVSFGLCWVAIAVYLMDSIAGRRLKSQVLMAD